MRGLRLLLLVGVVVGLAACLPSIDICDGPRVHLVDGECVPKDATDTNDDTSVDADTNSGADTDSTDPCGVDIRQTFPAADSVDFYHRGVVEFYLNKADETAVASIDGVDGTSSRNERNDMVTFAPDSPLAPSTSYTVQLDYCTGRAELSFATSELGGSVPDSVLEGKTYAFDMTSARMVEPEGVGALLQEQFEARMLVSPVEVSGGQVQLLSAAPTQDDPSQQDFCRSTRTNAGSYSEAPFFVVGPVDLTLQMSGYEVDVEGHLFSGTFAPDGGFIGGITLAGLIDTRPLIPLMFEGEDDPNAICDFVTGFGVSCVPCGGAPSEPYCLAARMVDGVATEVGTTLEAVESPCSHAQCDIPDCDPDGSTCSTPAGKATAWWVALVPLFVLPRRRGR